MILDLILLGLFLIFPSLRRAPPAPTSRPISSAISSARAKLYRRTSDGTAITVRVVEIHVSAEWRGRWTNWVICTSDPTHLPFSIDDLTPRERFDLERLLHANRIDAVRVGRPADQVRVAAIGEWLS